MMDAVSPTVARRRTLPPTYLLGAILAITALHFLFPLKHIVSWPWSIVGVLPLLAGLVLNLAADVALKKHATTVKPFEASSYLVTSGAYRVCRHPMYLGFTLILVGLAVLMGSLTPLMVIPVFVVLMETIFIRAEERMLEGRFGDTWRSYTETVRRWI
jgi:protein-S-isoprenylcysteine O-methyltransferase Ste14